MSSKRKYGDYKKDPTVKTPLLAWLSDRSMIYIAFASVAVFALAVIFSRGVAALERINTEPVENSPYMSIEAIDSPGQAWASSLIQEKPSNIESWAVAETTKPQNIVVPKDLNISSENVSTTMLSTYVGTGSGIETRIHVYGSGQAASDFNRFVEILSKRANIETATNDDGSSALYDNGFFITMGDTIISVNTPNNEIRNELLKNYSTKIPETLRESGCFDLTVNSNDANRSFFYNPDSYTGLQETSQIETQVEINDLPQPQSLALDEIQYPNLTRPESPLPEGFPTLPENEVSKPSLPNPVESKEEFVKDAVYQIADPNGPGCGWKWSGQVAPVYNLVDLESGKNKTVVDTQDSIDTEAQNYVESQKDWAWQNALVMPKIDDWNVYAKNVNETHDKWNWLNEEREKLREPWNRYVEDYRNWSSFDGRKAEATESYNEELQKCIDKQDELLEWEEQWGELWAEQEAAKNNPLPEEPETPTPTENPENPTDPSNPTETPSEAPTEAPETEEPVDIPAKPEGCSAFPERPAIVDQEKPAEPQAPEIPEGVTIPDSWEKP